MKQQAHNCTDVTVPYSTKPKTTKTEAENPKAAALEDALPSRHDLFGGLESSGQVLFFMVRL